MGRGKARIGRRARALASIAAAIGLSAVGLTTLLTPSRAVADPGISFVGPAVRELPTEVEFLSTSPHLFAGFSCYTGTYPGPTEPCQAYLVAYEGPDAGGRYHFRYNLPTAAPGPVHLEAQTPGGGDRLQVGFTAINSGTAFGDARSCLMPGANAAGQLAFEFGFYSQASATAVVFGEERTAGRWAAAKLKALANYPVGGADGIDPYTRRTLRFHVDEEALAAGDVRLRYFLMKGDHPRISAKQRRRALSRSSVFSTGACLPSGGI